MSFANGEPEVFTHSMTLTDTTATSFPMIPCRGAAIVNLSVAATAAGTLSAGIVRMLTVDGKTVDVTPGSLSGLTGTDSATMYVNAIGGVTVQDLSNATNHRDVTLRCKGATTDGPFSITPILAGVDMCTLRLTQSAVQTNTYTLTASVYYL